MRNNGLIVFLNGIQMGQGREPPLNDADVFISNVMKDLLSKNEAKKHKCTPECKEVWTICIGPSFTGQKDFMSCVPR